MEEKAKNPLKDITGQKILTEKELDTVSGGMSKKSDCSILCGTNPNSKGSYPSSGN